MQLLGTLGGLGTIAFGIFVFNARAESEAQRLEVQRQVETDRAQQDVIQAYLTDMKELVLDKVC